jgi:hypothetical protein
LGEDDPSLQLDMALESTDTAEVTTVAEGDAEADLATQVPTALDAAAPIFELSSPRDPAPTGDDTHEH